MFILSNFYSPFFLSLCLPLLSHSPVIRMKCEEAQGKGVVFVEVRDCAILQNIAVKRFELMAGRVGSDNNGKGREV